MLMIHSSNSLFCFRRWTNDVLRATPHQVIDRVVDCSNFVEIIPERFSIAFFCNANKDVMLDPIESLLLDGETPKYKPMSAIDYITNRLSATIANGNLVFI